MQICKKKKEKKGKKFKYEGIIQELIISINNTDHNCDHFENFLLS